MPIPTYDKFIDPILRVLATSPEGILARDAHDAAASALGLTDADKSERLPSGQQPIYKNRAGWAHDRLKRAGLSSSPRRGFWKITDEGRRYAAEHPAPLSDDEVTRLATENLDAPLRPPVAPGKTATNGSQVPHVTPILPKSPEERLEEAIDELKKSVSEDLLDTIGRGTPTFFEDLVLDLLHALGYGISRDDLQRVGAIGDGGIDGIISLDRLGLEKVYIQAKRWQNQVGRPEIQAFYGALAGQRARKGVFLTTSTFSQPAIDFAKSVEGIVLVDGSRLAELMMEHGVGVTHRLIKLPKVDSDYFEE